MTAEEISLIKAGRPGVHDDIGKAAGHHTAHGTPGIAVVADKGEQHIVHHKKWAEQQKGAQINRGQGKGIRAGAEQAGQRTGGGQAKQQEE